MSNLYKTEVQSLFRSTETPFAPRRKSAAWLEKQGYHLINLALKELKQAPPRMHRGSTKGLIEWAKKKGLVKDCCFLIESLDDDLKRSKG